MTTEQLTTCRLCPGFCGMIVELDGARVVHVRGDPEHPISRGYLCPKGRSLGAFHHHPNRLNAPSIAGRTATWDETLDDIAARLRAIVDAHGAEAVAHYSASGGGYDYTAVNTFRGFFLKLGSHQRYSAVTVDAAPALRSSQLVTGYPWEIRPEWFPDANAPRVGVILGSNPVVSHGYLGLMMADPVRRIRDYRESGGELWVVDPRRTETARFADHHLAPIPGTDAFLLAYLARELLRSGGDQDEIDRYVSPEDVASLRTVLEPFTVALAAERTGLAADQLEALLAAIRRAGRIAMTTGTGLTFGRHALLAHWLRWVVLILTGSVDREGGMTVDAGWFARNEEREDWKPLPADARPATPRSRPDLPMWLGEVPCAAMADEIEAGYIKALFINGGSPLTAFPQPDRIRAALQSLDLLVVSDVLDTELTAMATHVLPAASIIERSDIVGGWLHHMAYAPQLVPVGEDRRQVWWMFAQLGKRMGIDVLDGLDPDNTSDTDLLMRAAARGRLPAEDLVRAGPRGFLVPQPVGWVHEKALPDGRWRLAPKSMIERLPKLLDDDARRHRLQMVSGRELHNHNRVAYGRFGYERLSEQGARIGLHPDDAKAEGIAEGDLVSLRAEEGSVTAVARIDDGLRVGTVHITHGWIDRNAARLGSHAVDPEHGQPVMSAIPVEIERVGGRAAPGSGDSATFRQAPLAQRV